MAKKSLLEERISGEVVFNGRMISLERDTVKLPNGEQSIREIVKHPGAIAVVALDGDELILVRQYRYAIGRELLEIPAGKLDAGETPLVCAQRELREEIGYRGDLMPLGSFHMTPGYANEIIHFFWASHLISDPLPQDIDEFLEIERIPWPQAVEMAFKGDFIDAKTILGILLVYGKMQ